MSRHFWPRPSWARSTFTLKAIPSPVAGVAADPSYAKYLANWKENFFGWNAADFGWGADTVQNILWRLENGELDGINPKVIVLLGGTNNINAGQGDRNVSDITGELKACVDVIRKKAPDAVIILTGIFPRTPPAWTYAHHQQDQRQSFENGRRQENPLHQHQRQDHG